MRQPTFEGAVIRLRLAAREYAAATGAPITDWARINAADTALREAALVYAQLRQQTLTEEEDANADPG